MEPANSDIVRIDRFTGEHLHLFLEGPGSDGIAPLVRPAFPIR